MGDSPYPPSATSLDDVIAVLQDGIPELEGQTAAFTGLDHHLQCAAVLEQQYVEDRELQVAGLLHDIGHRLVPGHPEAHGVAAAEYLRDVFSERVCDLVELHVDAKRYLVATEPSYRDQLSEGSARTLIAQGEALDADGVEAFTSRLHAADAVKLRRADEAAKVPGKQVPALDAWLPVLQEVAR